MLHSLGAHTPRLWSSVVHGVKKTPLPTSAYGAFYPRRQVQVSTRSLSVRSLPFWKCRHTWRRAMVNTSRCLVGCSIGDLSTMWYIMAYHPTVDAATSMGLSMTAGITTSILLETALLRYGKDQLAWKAAVQTACGMSLVSMLAMEFTENIVTLGLADGMMSPADVGFWTVTAASMLAGFLAPLPYNYFRLKFYGKACH
ncbi:hypothetical protein D6C77_09453 [Aureobasidium pullulans]|nr:hypothetical protein D6D29_02877 [Aureobasidium pullulans]THY64506.1 hypothetical protein D6C99_00206 [Aureobasidium pullulans]TIA49784.1 hypothetical protein D6C77_09453 [Aureobasidium pullulans]